MRYFKKRVIRQKFHCGSHRESYPVVTLEKEGGKDSLVGFMLEFCLNENKINM
jgi:hypothetical protein